MKDSKRFYSGISIDSLKEYAKLAGMDTIPESQIIKHQTTLSRHSRILEVGVGYGRLVPFLSEHYNYTGIESNEDYFAYAKSNNPNADIRLTSIENFVFEEEFDAVLFPWSTMWDFSIDTQRDLLRRINPHIRRAGQVIIDIPTRESENNRTSESEGVFKIRNHDSYEETIHPLFEEDYADLGLACDYPNFYPLYYMTETDRERVMIRLCKSYRSS